MVFRWVFIWWNDSKKIENITPKIRFFSMVCICKMTVRVVSLYWQCLLASFVYAISSSDQIKDFLHCGCRDRIYEKHLKVKNTSASIAFKCLIFVFNLRFLEKYYLKLKKSKNIIVSRPQLPTLYWTPENVQFFHGMNGILSLLEAFTTESV